MSMCYGITGFGKSGDGYPCRYPAGGSAYVHTKVQVGDRELEGGAQRKDIKQVGKFQYDAAVAFQKGLKRKKVCEKQSERESVVVTKVKEVKEFVKMDVKVKELSQNNQPSGNNGSEPHTKVLRELEVGKLGMKKLFAGTSENEVGF